MATYKTRDGSQTGFVPGVGPIINGYLYNAPDNIENYNFIKVADPAPVAASIQAIDTATPAYQQTAPATEVQATTDQANTQSEGISG